MIPLDAIPRDRLAARGTDDRFLSSARGPAARPWAAAAGPRATMKTTWGGQSWPQPPFRRLSAQTRYCARGSVFQRCLPLHFLGTIAAMRAICCLVLLAGPLLSQQFDLLITGAKVIDGSGSAWFYADIGIRGDTIAAVGCSPAPPRTVAHRRARPGRRAGLHRHPLARTPRNLQRPHRRELPARRRHHHHRRPRRQFARCPSAPFLDRIRQTPISVNFATVRRAGHHPPAGDRAWSIARPRPKRSRR